VIHDHGQGTRVHEINGRKIEHDPVDGPACVGQRIVKLPAGDDIQVTDEGDDGCAIPMLGREIELRHALPPTGSDRTELIGAWARDGTDAVPRTCYDGTGSGSATCQLGDSGDNPGSIDACSVQLLGGRG